MALYLFIIGLVWISGYYGFALLAPGLPPLSHGMVEYLLSSLLCMSIIFICLKYLPLLRLDTKRGAMVLLISAVAEILFGILFEFHGLSSLFLLYFCIVGGLIAAGYIRSVELLIAIVISVAIIDPVGLLLGPGKIASTYDPITYLVTFRFPLWGTELIEPVFALGDLIFLVIFYRCSVLMGFEVKGGLSLMYLGLPIALLAAALFQTPIPALPFIAGIYILLYGRDLLRFNPQFKNIFRYCMIIIGSFALFAAISLTLEQPGS